MDEFVKGLLKMPRKSLEREFRDSPDQHKNTIYTLVEMVRKDISPSKVFATEIFNNLTNRSGVTLAWTHVEIDAAINTIAKMLDEKYGDKNG